MSSGVKDRLVAVSPVASFSVRRAAKVVLADDEVAVWHVDGTYYAVSAVCRHHHVPTLHVGERCGLTVSCPLHGWTYSLETGAALNGGGALRTYVTVVRDGMVWIRLPERCDGEQP